MDYDSDIQLKVSLKPGDVKKSAKDLQDSIARVFDESAGKNLDNQFKKIQATMSKTAGKAEDLQTKMKTLESTQIPTQEYVQASKEVDNLSAKFEKAVTAAEKVKQASSVKAQNIQSQMNELATKQIPTEEYNEAKKYVDQYANALIKAQERMDKFLETGGKKGSKQFTNIQYDIAMWEMKLMDAEDELKQIVELGRQFTLGKDTTKYAQLEGQLQKLNDSSAKQDEIVKKTGNDLELAKQKVEQLVKSGSAFKLGSDTDQYRKLSGDLADVNNQMRLSLLQLESHKKKLEESANASAQKAKQTKNVNEQLKKTIPAADRASKQVKKFGGAVKSASKQSSLFNINGKKLLFTFLKYGLGIRSLYILVNKLKAAVKETVNEIVKLNNGNNDLNAAMSKITSSFDYFKRSFGALFVPFIEAFAESIETLLDSLAYGSEKIGMFIAQISGKSSYIRAIKQNKDYAKSLQETSEAADKANDKLGTYDKLLVINKNKNSDDKQESQKFEEVPIQGVQKINAATEALNKSLKLAKKGIKLFADSAKRAFLDTWKYLDISKQIQKLYKNLQQIGKAVSNIFTDVKVVKSLENFINSLGKNIGKVAASFFSVGISVATNYVSGFLTYLQNNGNRISTAIADTLTIASEILDTWGNLAVAIANVFKAFESPQAIRFTASVIGTVADSLMAVWNLALKIVRDIYNVFSKPIIDNAEKIRLALENAFTPLSVIGESIKSLTDYLADGLMEMYDNHIKPYYDALAQGWSDTFGKFLDVYNEYVVPVLDGLANKFSEVVDGHVKPMVDKFLELIGTIADVVKQLYEEILKPEIDWLIENLIPVLMPVISELGNLILDFFGAVIDTVGNFMQVLSGLIKFVAGVFTGDWKMAWEGAKKISVGILNQIKTSVQYVFTHVRNIISTILTGITSVITVNVNKVRSIIQTFKTVWMQVFNSLPEPTKRVFTGIWNSVRNSINSILGGTEALINGLVQGLNKLIEMLNNLQITPPEWVTDMTGIGSFGFSLPYFREVSIPRLAQGAVIPPNREFMAMLGDQSSGVNIETPLDTMVNAFKTAISEMGGLHEPVVLQLNGRQIASAVWDENAKKYKQSLNYFPGVV